MVWCFSCGQSFLKRHIAHERKRSDPRAPKQNGKSGVTPHGWYQPEFRELHRDRLSAMKLAMAVRR